MTPEQLKLSIFKYAFQGRLTEHISSDSSVETLQNNIQREEKKAIEAGLIKRPQKLSPIIDEDVDLETPSYWKNIKLGEIFQLMDGEKRKGDEYNYLEVKYLRGKITPKRIKEGKFGYKGQRVILVDGENSGEVFALPEDGYIGSTFKILYISPAVDEKYVLTFFEYKRSELRENKKGAAIPHLNKELLFNYVLPLPPIEEQQRIVAKIQEILPYIDLYTAAYNKLEQINAKFPEDMKKSILQYAVQGKLVEQRSEEGTAEELYQQIQNKKKKLICEGKKKEKKFAKITEDDIPFDIPETWKWVRLASLCKSITDGDHQPPPQTDTGYPFLVISNLSEGKLSFSNTRHVNEEYFKSLSEDRVAENGDLLFTVTGSYGIVVKVDTDEKFCFQRHIALLKLLSEREYLYYALQSPLIKRQCDELATGIAQKTVGLNTLRNLMVPLPPVEEQKRIVKKIEELLPYCEKL